MAALRKVSMNLTERDIQNTESIRELLHVRTNADAVSAALGITKSLSEMVREGNEVLVRNKNGELQKLLFIPGLGKNE